MSSKPNMTQILTITTDQVFYDKDTKTFSEEASQLDISARIVYRTIRIKNPKTNQFRLFEFKEIMKSDSGLDIGAWIYKSSDLLTLIIFND